MYTPPCPSGETKADASTARLLSNSSREHGSGFKAPDSSDRFSTKTVGRRKLGVYYKCRCSGEAGPVAQWIEQSPPKR